MAGKKEFYQPLYLKNQAGSTPSTPAIGDKILYPKDGILYQMGDDGVEQTFGGSGNLSSIETSTNDNDPIVFNGTTGKSVKKTTWTIITSLLDTATTSLKGLMSVGDKTKLDGIATGATANFSDSYLLSRTNHTGSQAISTITDLQTTLDAKLSTSMPDNNFWLGNTSGIGALVTMSSQASMNNTGAVTLSNAAVIAKVMTGFTSGFGVISATDSILSAIQKLDGNIKLYAKSYAVNGSFSIWNRGTSFSVTDASHFFIADCWVARRATSTLGIQVSRSTDVPSADFLYSLKVNRPLGDVDSTETVRIMQVLDNRNNYAGGTYTLSGWFKFGSQFQSAGGNIFLGLQSLSSSQGNPNDVISSKNTTTPSAITGGFATIPVTTTGWTKFSKTVTIPSGLTDLVIMISTSASTTTAATANDFFLTTGITLEYGSSSSTNAPASSKEEQVTCLAYLLESTYASVTASSTISAKLTTVNSASATTQTLPKGTFVGEKYSIKNKGSGTVTMATTSSQTIDGASASSTTILTGAVKDFVFNGTEWEVR